MVNRVNLYSAFRITMTHTHKEMHGDNQLCQNQHSLAQGHHETMLSWSLGFYPQPFRFGVMIILHMIVKSPISGIMLERYLFLWSPKCVVG